MPEASKKSGAISLTGAMALVAAMVGAAFVLHPLVTSRPTIETQLTLGRPGLEDVEARLWQDPFQAAWEHQEACDASSLSPKTSTPSTSHVACNHKHGVGDLKGLLLNKRDVLVLGVMVNTGAYAELTEQRLRSRVAVLEGLAVAGFTPEVADHLGFVRLPLAADKGIAAEPRMLLPFESFSPTSAPMMRAKSIPNGGWPSHVLLLWLDEDALIDQPLYRLSQLFETLQKEAPLGEGSRIELIGPASSSTLRAMAEEGERSVRATGPYSSLSNSKVYSAHSRIRMYSPTATAADEILLKDLQLPGLKDRPGVDKVESVRDLILLGGGPGLDLVRTTRTDRYFTRTLVHELYLRLAPKRDAIDPPRFDLPLARDPKPQPFARALGHIALVSEWDTFYGRALPESFQNALCGQPDSNSAAGSVEADDCRSRLHMSYYLRGIDGRTSHHVSAAAAPAAHVPSPPDGVASLWTPTPGESTEGYEQLDYLRRLASSLADLDGSLRESHDKIDQQGIRAIGVLGTDVYDKLLILRALRSKFPGIVFFTTGLDARYSMPSEWAAAHNLVVVSPFDLELEKTIQAGVPPFRDSDQTAEFASTLAALGVLDIRIDDPERNNAIWGPARRFEIGRFGPVNLTPEEDFAGGSIQPAAHELMAMPTEGWPRIAVLVLATQVLAILMRRPKHDRDRRKTYVFLTCLILAELWVTFIISMSCDQKGRGQPLYFLSGVSVVSTNILRGMAALLSVYFIWSAWQGWNRNNEEIHQCFGFEFPPRPRQEGDPASSRAHWDWLKWTGPARPWLEKTFRGTYGAKWRVFQCKDDTGNSQGPFGWDEIRDKERALVSPANLWEEYLSRGRCVSRLLRIVPLIVIYLSVFVMFGLGATPAPVRGWRADTAQWRILMLAVFASLALLFWVLDSTLLNRAFIRYLGRATTEWPPEYREHYARKSGLGQDIQSEDFTEYLDIKLIAMRTRVVGESVYYPFVVLGLMLLARSSLFEDWHWGKGLWIIMACNVFIAISSALMLRSAAEEARGNALERLRARRLQCLANEEKHAGVINEIIAAVENERSGAFSILSQHPVLASLLLPSGGAGLWIFLEYFARSGH